MTPQLYSPGEENWPNRYHIGCGGIYLKGYVNIDSYGIAVDCVSEDELENNTTTVDNYYKALDGEWDHLPKPRRTIVDVALDMRDLHHTVKRGAISKIVAIQCLEHLTPVDLFEALEFWRPLFRSGGEIIASVPDMIDTLVWLKTESKREFALRHLSGSRKNEWSVHRSWWTNESFPELLSAAGFVRLHPLENIHFYPALVWKGYAP